MKARASLAIVLACLVVPSKSNATFSIAACAPDGSCGVAVATNNVAVWSFRGREFDLGEDRIARPNLSAATRRV